MIYADSFGWNRSTLMNLIMFNMNGVVFLCVPGSTDYETLPLFYVYRVSRKFFFLYQTEQEVFVQVSCIIIDASA